MRLRMVFALRSSFAYEIHFPLICRYINKGNFKGDFTAGIPEKNKKKAHHDEKTITMNLSPSILEISEDSYPFHDLALVFFSLSRCLPKLIGQSVEFFPGLRLLYRCISRPQKADHFICIFLIQHSLFH